MQFFKELVAHFNLTVMERGNNQHRYIADLCARHKRSQTAIMKLEALGVRLERLYLGHAFAEKVSVHSRDIDFMVHAKKQIKPGANAPFENIIGRMDVFGRAFTTREAVIRLEKTLQDFFYKKDFATGELEKDKSGKFIRDPNAVSIRLPDPDNPKKKIELRSPEELTAHIQRCMQRYAAKHQQKHSVRPEKREISLV